MTEDRIQKAKNNPTNNGMLQTQPLRQLIPAMDLFESGEQYWLIFDMPGAEAATLEVKITEQELHVQAKRTALYGETQLSSFNRVIDLPGEIDAESVSAELNRGVLELKLAKSKASRTVTIPVDLN